MTKTGQKSRKGKRMNEKSRLSFYYMLAAVTSTAVRFNAFVHWATENAKNDKGFE